MSRLNSSKANPLVIMRMIINVKYIRRYEAQEPKRLRSLEFSEILGEKTKLLCKIRQFRASIDASHPRIVPTRPKTRFGRAEFEAPSNALDIRVLTSSLPNCSGRVEFVAAISGIYLSDESRRTVFKVSIEPCESLTYFGVLPFLRFNPKAKT